MTAVDPRQYMNDDEESFRLAIEGFLSKAWTAMPAIVQSVNLSAMTLTAQIAIQGISEDQNGSTSYQNVAQLLDVPICFLSGGGFTVSVPLKPGDEVLIVFASRCIDSWWQNGGFNNKPMELRMHDLSDGFAIPGPRSQPRKVPGISASDLQVTDDGGTKLFSIAPGGDTFILGNLEVKGSLLVDQDIMADGEVTAKLATIPIPLSTHHHTGVTPGGGTSGPPTP